MSCALYSWSIMGRIWSSSEIYNQWADTPRTKDQCAEVFNTSRRKEQMWRSYNIFTFTVLFFCSGFFWGGFRGVCVFRLRKHSRSERGTCWLRVSALFKFKYVIHWQRNAPTHTSRAWFMQSVIVPPGARGVVDGIAVFVPLHCQGSPKLLQRGSEMAVILAKGFQKGYKDLTSGWRIPWLITKYTAGSVFMTLLYSCLLIPAHTAPFTHHSHAIMSSERAYREQTQSWSFPACSGPSVWCLVWQIMVCCYYAFTSRPQGGRDRDGSVELRSGQLERQG